MKKGVATKKRKIPAEKIDGDDRVIHRTPVSIFYRRAQKVHLQCFDQLNEEQARKRHRRAELDAMNMNEQLERVRRAVSQRLGSAVTCRVLANDILWKWEKDVVAISMTRREFDMLTSNPEGLAKLIAGRLR